MLDSCGQLTRTHNTEKSTEAQTTPTTIGSNGGCGDGHRLPPPTPTQNHTTHTHTVSSLTISN